MEFHPIHQTGLWELFGPMAENYNFSVSEKVSFVWKSSKLTSFCNFSVEIPGKNGIYFNIKIPLKTYFFGWNFFANFLIAETIKIHFYYYILPKIHCTAWAFSWKHTPPFNCFIPKEYGMPLNTLTYIKKRFLWKHETRNAIHILNNCS